MDEDRLPQSVRGVIADAIAEAQRRAATDVAAEHLLLALTADSGSPAAALLAEFGLDHDAVERALDEERMRSLAVVGIERLDPDLLTATRRGTRPGWAASTREVFRRTQPAGGHGRRRPAMELDLLSGIVTANVGTVPRALAFAGVDRDTLIGRVERARRADDDDRRRPGASAQERQAVRREALQHAQQERREASWEAQRRRREAMRDLRGALDDTARQREDPGRDERGQS